MLSGSKDVEFPLLSPARVCVVPSLSWGIRMSTSLFFCSQEFLQCHVCSLGVRLSFFWNLSHTRFCSAIMCSLGVGLSIFFFRFCFSSEHALEQEAINGVIHRDPSLAQSYPSYRNGVLEGSRKDTLHAQYQV